MTAAQFRTCAVCGRRVQLVSGGRPAVHTMGERADDWSAGYRAGVIDAREGRPPRVHHGALTDAGTGYLAGYWRTRDQLRREASR